MKKFSFLLIALFFVARSFAQCTIDTAALSGSAGGYYPAPNHLPHIVQDSAYSQTVQGKIETGFTQSFTVPVIGAINVTITVDSVRLDSIQGLPAGITWAKNPNVLPGGGYGCVLFSGSTTDSAGRYNLTPIGMVWAHLYAPLLGLNKDTFQYGPLNRLPNYNGYYLVVDSAPAPLSVTNNTRVSCLNDSSGTATIYAAGGSPTDPYTYLWSNGETTYNLTNVVTGTYYATITSGTDTLYDTVTIVGDPTPVAITVTTDSGSRHGNGLAVISVTGGVPPYTYRWNNGDTTSTIDSLAPGTYRVTVRDSLGCRANDSVVIANLSVGIDAIQELNAQMSLSPNPAKNQLNVVIESPVTINAKIEAVDITGKIVYSVPANISNSRFTQTIDVSKFSAGIYILQLTSANQSIHQRFVVTR